MASFDEGLGRFAAARRSCAQLLSQRQYQFRFLCWEELFWLQRATLGCSQRTSPARRSPNLERYAAQRAVMRHRGTACRYGDYRLSLVVPEADEQAATLLTFEISADIEDGPKVRVVAAPWRRGEPGLRNGPRSCLLGRSHAP